MENETKTYCDSCAEPKDCAEYSINGETFWHCDDCAEKPLDIVGYFSYDCQEDGYCTFGCGKRPNTLCVDCIDEENWLEGTVIPINWHPIETTGEENVDVCDRCGEMFGQFD